MFLGLKCDTPPFDDVNARLAVLYGIDRQSLVDNVVLGGQTVRGIIPEGTMGYSKSFPEIKYDPEYAKGLLAKTSYNGEELEFIAPIGWYVKQSEQCQAIIADLKEVGFNIKLTMLEGATFSSTRNNGIYSIYTTGCAHPASDPNLFLSQRVKGDSAKSGYVNEELNAKIDEAASNADPIKRQELYEQVVQVMLDNAAPMIPLFQWERIYAVSDKIDLDASADTFRSDLRMDLRFVVFK
jgi:ABC-type transport system substrate-binding protein